MRTSRWMKRAMVAPLVVAIIAALTMSASAYDDVPEGRYYSDAVTWLDAHEISAGTSATEFSPHRGITRAEFLALLWRLAGSPAPFGDSHAFGDAPSAGPFTTAIDWAYGTTIATGRTTSVLDPNAVITRGEALAILWRYMCRPTGAAPHGFADVAGGAFYDAAAAWGKADGVAFGRTPTRLDPDAEMTRAEAAAMLWRLAGSPAVNGAGINRTTDAPTCGGDVAELPPVNSAPVLDDVGDRSVDEGDELALTVTATDPDGDNVTFSLVGEPAGASITEAGDFSFRSKAEGEFTFEVMVVDDGEPSMSDSGSFTVTVDPVNTAPTLEEVETQYVESGEPVEFTAFASDDDTPEQTLTFSLDDAPRGATISEDGEFSWTAPEVDGEEIFSFDVIVTDDGEPEELSDSQTVEIYVEGFFDLCEEAPWECDPCFFETLGDGPFGCDPCLDEPFGGGPIGCDPCLDEPFLCDPCFFEPAGVQPPIPGPCEIF